MKFILKIFTIVLLVIVILFVVAVGFFTVSGYSLKISEDSTYVYEILPKDLTSNDSLSSFLFGSHVKDLNSHLNANDVNYFITVHADYWDVINRYKAGVRWIWVNGSWHTMIDGVKYDSSRTGFIASKFMYIVIKIDSIKNDGIMVNVILSMKDGYAKFGLNFSPLPLTDTGWSLWNGSYVSSFSYLNMSKKLIIKNDHDTLDLFGTKLGEWPFWLRTTKSRNEVVLYGLNDFASFSPNEPFFGDAKIIFINMSRTAPSDFRIDNIDIKSQEQIYNDKGFLGGVIKISNVTPEEKDEIVGFIKGIYETTEARKMLESSIFPLSIDYVNNTLIIFKDILPSIVDLRDKPWSYVSNAYTSEHVSEFYGVKKLVIDTIRGIKYDNKLYMTSGFIDLKNVSYERNTGLLLYLTAKTDATGALDSLLPSVIVRAFGIVGFELTKYSTLSITLVSYIPSSNILSFKSFIVMVPIIPKKYLNWRSFRYE